MPNAMIMTRERVTIFIISIVSLIIVPGLLPLLFGHLYLPLWAYLFWGTIILLLGCTYIANRCWLIDRYLVRRRFLPYLLFNIIIIALGSALAILCRKFFESFYAGDESLADVIDHTMRISQMTLFICLEIAVVLIALVVAMSDKWRAAAFLYHEVKTDKENLEKDVDTLKGEVESLKSRQNLQDKEAPDHISVKVNLMMTRVKLDDILFVKSDGDYVIINKEDEETLMTLMTLKAMEKQLPYGRFTRTHRSYIVNVDKVMGLKDGKIIVGSHSVPLSDSYKASFFELMSHKSIVLRTNPS